MIEFFDFWRKYKTNLKINKLKKELEELDKTMPREVENHIEFLLKREINGERIMTWDNVLPWTVERMQKKDEVRRHLRRLLNRDN